MQNLFQARSVLADPPPHSIIALKTMTWEKGHFHNTQYKAHNRVFLILRKCKVYDGNFVPHRSILLYHIFVPCR
jgi:hypothetical protein